MIKKIFTQAHDSAEKSVEKSSSPDYKVMLICITVAFSLTLINYLGNYKAAVSFLQSTGFTDLSIHFQNLMTLNRTAQLNRLAYWISIIMAFYVLLPTLVIKFILKEKLGDYGLKVRGAIKDYRIYLLMLCIMIPIIWFFSRTAGFQARYPFYEIRKGEPLYPGLFVWELLYLSQFFAVEFFFRGFMLHGTKRQFGFYSVFAMTIPYCMVHFGKPMPEALAAIVAGIVLGTFSLKSGSIWLGVAIHFSVALTMDLCSLWQKGLLNLF